MLLGCRHGGGREVADERHIPPPPHQPWAVASGHLCSLGDQRQRFPACSLRLSPDHSSTSGSPCCTASRRRAVCMIAFFVVNEDEVGWDGGGATEARKREEMIGSSLRFCSFVLLCLCLECLSAHAAGWRKENTSKRGKVGRDV